MNAAVFRRKALLALALLDPAGPGFFLTGTMLAAPAQAEPVDWATPFAGEWTLSGVSEGDPYCLITLGDEGTIGGAALEISATCLRQFPLQEAFAWTVRDDNALVLADAGRQAVLTLAPQTAESYSGEFEDGRMISFDRGGFPEPELDELMDGTFALSGYNNAEACGFYIEAGGADSGPLDQVGDCADPWKGKDWSSWRREDGKLELLDSTRETILSLTRADAFTFTVDGHDGLFFGTGSIEVSE